jgi:hypothetical protein
LQEVAFSNPFVGFGSRKVVLYEEEYDERRF